jgi:hypothetical protein
MGKAGDFSLDDENRPGRPLNAFAQVIYPFLGDEPLIPARVLPERLATSPHTIRNIVARDLGMRQFPRRWVPHELTSSNKKKRVKEAQMLLQAPRSDSEDRLAHIGCSTLR